MLKWLTKSNQVSPLEAVLPPKHPRFKKKPKVHPVQRSASVEDTLIENMEFQEIPYGELRFDERGFSLGAGTFGVVYKGHWEGHLIAVKKFHSDKQANEVFLDEKKLMKALGRHPHILFSYGTSISQTNSNLLVLEYMPGGNLSQYLQQNPRINEHQAQIRQKIALQVAQGLACLWSLRIIHRDIKAENILLNSNHDAKIGDFGLAMQIAPDAPPYMNFPITGGTPGWLPPEAINKSPCLVEAYDTWSYATLLWMLAAYHQWAPFPEIKSGNISDQLIIYGKEGKTPTICSTTSLPCQVLLFRCWNKNSALRPKASEIVELLESGLPLASTLKPL